MLIFLTNMAHANISLQHLMEKHLTFQKLYSVFFMAVLLDQNLLLD
jgi:hypothetical protein